LLILLILQLAALTLVQPSEGANPAVSGEFKK
jgi:hypothetical protein